MISHTRLGALILMLVLIVPMLAACGGGGSGAGAPTTAPAGGGAATSAPTAGGVTQIEGATAGGSGDVTKITIEDGATLRVASWGDPSEQKVNQDAFARFNKIFPNIRIKYEPQPKDFQTTMKADVAGGTEPDVF